MRSPLATLLVVLVAGASACGQTGTRGGLPEESAQALRAQLRDVEQAVQRGECEGLDAELLEVDEAIDDLPASVDDRLERRLRNGAARLRETAQSDCTEQNTQEGTQTQETTPPETTTTEPEPEPTDTTQTEPEPTETQPEETQPEETQPEQTEPEQTQPEETQPEQGEGAEGESGGAEAGEEGE